MGELFVPTRFTLQWHITERCNLTCAHCYQQGGAAEELPLAKLKEIVAHYCAFLAGLRVAARAPLPAQIKVTGGEPFMRSDFFELLELFYQRRSEFRYSILSNGTLIDQAVAHRLKQLDVQMVQVSIEGSRETHEAIRGPGSYAAAVEGIRALVAAGVYTVVSFTAHRRNFMEFPHVAWLGRRLGVQMVWSDRLIPRGRGAELLGLQREETQAYIRLVAHTQELMQSDTQNRTRVRRRRALQFLAGEGRPYYCKAGDQLLALLPNGDVVPCRRLPLVVGNVFEEPLAHVYQHATFLKALRHPLPIAGCEECRYHSDCRGGLRCLAYAVYHDPFKRDPGCWL